MTKRDDEGFLERWSRRKQAAQAEHAGRDLNEEAAPADEKASGAGSEAFDATASTGTPGGEERAGQGGGDTSHAEIEAANREAAEAVDLEALSFESDYSVFLKKGVPSALKNAALRKLWSSNPVLANVDGLNDYDEDFRLGNQLGREFKSAWEVGRGYGRKIEEMNAKLAEERRLAALAGDTADDEAAAADDIASSSDDDPQTGGGEREAAALAPGVDETHSVQITPAEGTVPEEDAGDEARPKVSLRRRMTFAQEP